MPYLRYWIEEVVEVVRVRLWVLVCSRVEHAEERQCACMLPLFLQVREYPQLGRPPHRLELDRIDRSHLSLPLEIHHHRHPA